MKRLILSSSGFTRSAKRAIKKNPELAAKVQSTLELLSEDAFHPTLKTHKLKGKLDGSWACSVAYDLRIMFNFVEYNGDEAILLEAIGTHDEIY